MPKRLLLSEVEDEADDYDHHDHHNHDDEEEDKETDEEKDKERDHQKLNCVVFMYRATVFWAAARPANTSMWIIRHMVPKMLIREVMRPKAMQLPQLAPLNQKTKTQNSDWGKLSKQFIGVSTFGRHSRPFIHRDRYISRLEPWRWAHQCHWVHVGQIRARCCDSWLEPPADGPKHIVQHLYAVLQESALRRAEMLSLQSWLVDKFVPTVGEPIAVNFAVSAVKLGVCRPRGSVTCLSRISEPVEHSAEDVLV